MIKGKFQFWYGETLCKWLIKVCYIANLKGPVYHFFCSNPSETYPKSMDFGKCPNHFTASELLLKEQWTSTDTVVVSWVRRLAFVASSFIVNNGISISSRNNELVSLVLLKNLLLLPLCIVFHCHLYRDKHRFQRFHRAGPDLWVPKSACHLSA